MAKRTSTIKAKEPATKKELARKRGKRKASAKKVSMGRSF